MGDLLVLADRRATRRRGDNYSPGRRAVDLGAPPAAFCFDLGCPFSYLVAERVERCFPMVDWVPVSGASLSRSDARSDRAPRTRARAERRAAELRLPLVWPDHFPPAGGAALRIAVYAVREGVGSAFALAAFRLAFCGGFDLEDPVILADAAAAAGIELDACLRAAGDSSHDEPVEAAALGLMSQGVTQVPALRVGTRWFAGESRLAEAAAFARAPVAGSLPA